jgi:hypothetical protein
VNKGFLSLALYIGNDDFVVALDLVGLKENRIQSFIQLRFVMRLLVSQSMYQCVFSEKNRVH